MIGTFIRRAGALALAASICADAPAGAGPLEDGVLAAQRGDMTTAKAKLEPLAQSGDAIAQYVLGDIIVRFANVLYKSEGVIWLQEAAKAGVPNAMNDLAVIYAEGKLMSTDQKRADELLRQAASLGFAPAYYNLGTRAALGVGRPADLYDAMEWFRLAADQNHAESQFNLGAMLAESNEVRINKKKAAEAYMWLTLAARQGHPKAREGRALFVAVMKPDEVAEGDRMVAAWKPIEPKKRP
jgi:uncharacterized protein